MSNERGDRGLLGRFAIINVRFGSLADKRSWAKVRLCPLWSNSGHSAAHARRSPVRAFVPLIYLKAEITDVDIVFKIERVMDCLLIALDWPQARIRVSKTLSGADFVKWGQLATWLLRFGAALAEWSLPTDHYDGDRFLRTYRRNGFARRMMDQFGRIKNTAIKRSISINGRKTSVSLENEFWQGLLEYCRPQSQETSHACGTDRPCADHLQPLVCDTRIRLQSFSGKRITSARTGGRSC